MMKIYRCEEDDGDTLIVNPLNTSVAFTANNEDRRGNGIAADVNLTEEDTRALRDQLNEILGDRGQPPATAPVGWVETPPALDGRAEIHMGGDEARRILNYLTERAGGVLSDEEKTALRWVKGNIKRMRSETDSSLDSFIERFRRGYKPGKEDALAETKKAAAVSKSFLQDLDAARDERDDLRKQLEQEKERRQLDADHFYLKGWKKGRKALADTMSTYVQADEL